MRNMLFQKENAICIPPSPQSHLFGTKSSSFGYCNSQVVKLRFPLSGIHLQFLNFSTEAIHDYLEIRSGTLEAGSVIDRFSGPLVPKPLFSTTHQTSFFFHSDYSQNKPGFHITYQGARRVLSSLARRPV